MLSYEKFRKADGRIDIKAHREAEIENGDMCCKCGRYIVFGGKGIKTKCSSCREMLSSKKEIVHDTLIRCPHCKNSFDPMRLEMYEVFSDGDHTVECPSCEGKLIVTTNVSYSFTSPPIIENEQESEKETEDAAQM